MNFDCQTFILVNTIATPWNYCMQVKTIGQLNLSIPCPSSEVHTPVCILLMNNYCNVINAYIYAVCLV